MWTRIWVEGLIGEGVVVVGLFGDQGPQGGIGRKDAVVGVAVEAGWGEDGCEAIQELENGEMEGGPPGGIGPREEVEDLVGAVAYQVESVEGEGGPGTVADQSFEPGAVVGFDADAGV